MVRMAGENSELLHARHATGGIPWEEAACTILDVASTAGLYDCEGMGLAITSRKDAFTITTGTHMAMAILLAVSSLPLLH